MFHFGRCGSTVTSELLNQHPDIKWDNELFDNLQRNPKGFIDTQYETDYVKILNNRFKRTKEKIYGFEIKAHNNAHFHRGYLNTDLDEFIDTLFKQGFGTIIILKRKNYLKQLISIARGIQNQKFHYKKNEVVSLDKTHLNPKNAVYGNFKGELIKILEGFDKQYDLIDDLLEKKGVSSLKLNYEDHIEKNPVIAYNSICRYLNISAEEVKVKQKKISSGKILNEVLEPNILINYLSNTPYEWMLNE